MKIGYGGSDPRPGRTPLDWPDDYAGLADQLHLPPCPVIGWSAGGRYAMALGIGAPDRTQMIGLAASVGPIHHVPGAVEDLTPVDMAAMELLARDRPKGLAAIDNACAWIAGEGWEALSAESWGESDDRVLADPATLEAMKAQTREAARQGSAGFAADDLDAYTPWGFSVEDIRQRVHIWSGGSDQMVGQNHADYLASTIPTSHARDLPGRGSPDPDQPLGRDARGVDMISLRGLILRS